MKLVNIFGKIFKQEIGNIEIDNLSFDSKDVKKNSLYFCIKGNLDGHDFAQEAIDNGAVALVVERILPLASSQKDIPQILVKNSRQCMAISSCKFFDNPSAKLKIIGITGTNGKTTTTYILDSILRDYGANVAIIGTNAIIYAGKRIEAKMTTPDPIELNGYLADMVSCGIEYVIMEVSAHAIALDKMSGIEVEVAAFTNFSQDHLDYFKTIEAYRQTKISYFDKRYAKIGVVNIDDECGREISKCSDLPIITYGSLSPADIFSIELQMTCNGLCYVLNSFDDIAKIVFGMTGKFNMYNTLCAAAIARALKIPIKNVASGIMALKRVDGRFNVISTNKCSFVIDFAHTIDGLYNILHAIADFAPKRIITVFGCGGNRDRDKRSKMGKVAAEESDYCIVTSDNPRFENPLDIIREVEQGILSVSTQNYECIVDRKEAITRAYEIAELDDIVLIAGKGAEAYQEINGIKLEYSDEKFLKELLGSKII